MLSRDQFIHWMHDPVTEVMQRHILDLAKVYRYNLSETCGVNSGDDMLNKGIIKGIEEGWNLEQILQEMFKDDSESDGMAASSQAY